jgi:hypothetical protein
MAIPGAMERASSSIRIDWIKDNGRCDFIQRVH